MRPTVILVGVLFCTRNSTVTLLPLGHKFCTRGFGCGVPIICGNCWYCALIICGDCWNCAPIIYGLYVCGPTGGWGHGNTCMVLFMPPCWAVGIMAWNGT
eukprot:10755156-Ditylum_brightwellii.AAC.1